MAKELRKHINGSYSITGGEYNGKQADKKRNKETIDKKEITFMQDFIYFILGLGFRFFYHGPE